jgi:hypothetical protein
VNHHLMFFLIGCGVIGCSELDAARKDALFGRAARAVVTVTDPTQLSAYAGKLVHLRAPVTGSPCLDPEFDLKVDGAWIHRLAQVRERRRKGTGWREESSFSATFAAPDARLGDLELDEAVLASCLNPRPVAFPAEGWALPTGLSGTALHVLPDGLFLGNHPSTPRKGDRRIRWTHVPFGMASVLARAGWDGRLVPAVEGFDRPFALMMIGDVSPETMFAVARKGNFWKHLPFRLAGILLILYGIFPARHARFSPFKAMLAVASTLALVAVCWLGSRPVEAIATLVALGLLAMLFRRQLVRVVGSSA